MIALSLRTDDRLVAITPPLDARGAGPCLDRPASGLDGLDSIRGLRLRLASPDQIRAWSSGEVTTPATLDALTSEPVPGGLGDEAIFGPLRVWRCGCPHARPPKPAQRACPRCGQAVAAGQAQRERFGHITLAVPCPHPWFSRGPGAALPLLLGWPARRLTATLRGEAVVVLALDAEGLRQARATARGGHDPETRRLGRALATLAVGAAPPLTVAERVTACWPGLLTVGHGAHAIQATLTRLDLAREIGQLDEVVRHAHGTEASHLHRRLAVLHALQGSDARPEWLLLTVLPVLPPALRPTLVQPDGRVITSDLNRLYARVIARNTHLRRLQAKPVPVAMLRLAEQALQQAVADLLTGERLRPGGPRHHRPLVGLSERLAGKRGRFRQHLLGKRVDYSGRAVIVPGPTLRLGQVGLPRRLALELCRPFVVRWLLAQGQAATVRAATRLIRRGAPVVWTGLEQALAGRLVLLNRAPTLHWPSLQAFEPLLVDGQAIQLHPLACAAFNADFDGDTMAIHLPLSDAAQAEARERLWAVHTLLAPATGEPLVTPSKDIVLGCHYLTLEREDALGQGKLCATPEEAILAHELGRVALQARVRVRVPVCSDADTPPEDRVITATSGRCVFNQALPPGLRWRAGLTDGGQDRGALKRLLVVAGEEGGPGLLAEVADILTDLGFHWATTSGISLSVFDVPQADTAPILADADQQVARLDDQRDRGLLSRAEHERALIAVWQGVMPAVTAAVQACLAVTSDLALMVRSGARGDLTQLVQLCGLRGLMVGPTGAIIPMPVRANFRQGLTPLEYWTAAPGARKGRGDTALNTARAGYLTRRLVAAAQDVLVTEADCGDETGWWIRRGDLSVMAFARRLRGCGVVEVVPAPDADGDSIPTGDPLPPTRARRLAARATAVRVRSPLTCRTRWGVCQRCYGEDLTTGELVALGVAVGVIGAQAVGEPGTQLTLRTVHAGGVATGPDIVAGLPRVEELFEARRPLTAGPLDPQEIVDTRGLRAVQRTLLDAIQAIYTGQGVTVDDRHVEVLLRQMSRTARVSEAGDTRLVAGALVTLRTLAEANDRARAQGGEPAIGEALLVGVSEVARTSPSFLAAAAFQATTRVLAEAALAGRVDELRGPLERVLLGQRIPAGTGFGVSVAPSATHHHNPTSIMGADERRCPVPAPCHKRSKRIGGTP